MIMDNADIELLRLAGWCKNIPSDIYSRFGVQTLDPQIIEQLEKLRLVNTTRKNPSIRLRPKGQQLLRNIGFDYHFDAGYISDFERRIEIAYILLTFYRAGFDVFANGADDLVNSQVFLQSAVARRDSSPGDLWGGASFHGIASIGNYVSACYFVSGHEEAMLHRRNERLLLDRTAIMLRRNESQIFAGSDYLSIAKILRNPIEGTDNSKSQKRTYAEMYLDSSCSLFLLECSDAGALQLLIMGQEQYRKRLGKVITHVEPNPPVGVLDADGELLMKDEPNPLPWILAVDMDVRRIDRAYRQTIDAGHPKLIVFCLKEQQKAIQYLYGKKEHIKLYAISKDCIDKAFGELQLYEPNRGAYYDSEGGVLNVAALPIHRED